MRHKESIPENSFLEYFISYFSREITVKNPPVFCVSPTLTCELEVLSHFCHLPNLGHGIVDCVPHASFFRCSSPSTPFHKGMDSICCVQFIHSDTILMIFLVWSRVPHLKKRYRNARKSVARVILGMMVFMCGKLFS